LVFRDDKIKNMEFKLKWHHVNEMMPEKKIYVLVETRFSKYPFITAYFNGINWINCDDKSIMQNVIYWAKVETPVYCQAESW
jgi:hypothetical protein